VRALLVLAVSVPIVVVAGCGSSSKSPSSSDNGVASKSATDILAAATAAADSASSVHVSGSAVDNGTPFVIDLHIVAGKGGEGRLSEKGVSFDLVRIGPDAYIKGTKAFYTKFAGAGAAQLLQGKWLKAPATTGQLAALTPLTDIHKFITKALSNHGALSKTGTTTINGQQVVGVKDTTKGGVLYVATTGKPYPVEITGGGTTTGTLMFTDWNKAVALAAPANAVDISKLKG
jgi:hypothetical protein